VRGKFWGDDRNGQVAGVGGGWLEEAKVAEAIGSCRFPLKTANGLFECQHFVLQLKAVEIEFPVVCVGDGRPVLDFLVLAIGALLRAKIDDGTVPQSGIYALIDAFALFDAFATLDLAMRIENVHHQSINAVADAFPLDGDDFLHCKRESI
jgi:hypothetical protein